MAKDKENQSRDDVLRRMLKTPPQPHKLKVVKPKPRIGQHDPKRKRPPSD